MAEQEELTAAMVIYRKRTTGVDNTRVSKVSAAFPRHQNGDGPPTHLDRFGNYAAVAIDMGEPSPASFRLARAANGSEGLLKPSAEVTGLY